MKVTPGRQKPYLCQDGVKVPRFVGLLLMLKELFTPTRWRKLRGRIKPGTHKRQRVTYPKRPGNLGGKREASPYEKIKRENVPSRYTLDSTPPRIVTAAVLGPNVLARNHFPNVLDVPEINLTEEEALRLTIKDQERKLRRMYGK
jgi:hypothetical protein